MLLSGNLEKGGRSGFREACLLLKGCDLPNPVSFEACCKTPKPFIPNRVQEDRSEDVAYLSTRALRLYFDYSAARGYKSKERLVLAD